MVEYCRMGVEILRRACLAFRKIMVKIGDTDPFVNATTIASTCSYLYRKNFLKDRTIGLVPPAGCHRSDKFSQKSIEWLLLCERDFGREIIYSGRTHEFRLPEGFKVDSFLPTQASEPNTANFKGTVFKFQGCFFHGCPTCFVTQRDRPVVFGRAMREVYGHSRYRNERQGKDLLPGIERTSIHMARFFSSVRVQTRYKQSLVIYLV